MDKISSSSMGLGVDSSGGPVIDPTANVLSLVLAAVTRLDDLRSAETRRLEDLQISEMKRVDDIAKLRAEYQEKLTLAESKRIDAIRAVDVAAVATANERAITQASVLANQVAQSAETLRALVASTAAAFSTQQQQLQAALTERIMALEKSANLGAGRQTVSDPMLSDLVNEMRSLRETGERRTGVQSGASTMWGYIVGAVGILTAVLIAVSHFAK